MSKDSCGPIVYTLTSFKINPRTCRKPKLSSKGAYVRMKGVRTWNCTWFQHYQSFMSSCLQCLRVRNFICTSQLHFHSPFIQSHAEAPQLRATPDAVTGGRATREQGTGNKCQKSAPKVTIVFSMSLLCKDSSCTCVTKYFFIYHYTEASCCTNSIYFAFTKIVCFH